MTTTYYCSPTGDDNREGTSDAAPIRTFQLALDRMKPGDEVKLAPGDYVGAAKYGDAALLAQPYAPIVVTGGVGVRIRGGNNRGHGLTLEGFNGALIFGLDVGDLPAVTNGAGLWLADMLAVHVDGLLVDLPGEWGVLTSFVRDALFTNCVLNRARKQHGLYVGNSSGSVTIKNCQLLGNRLCGIQCNGDKRMDSGRGLATTGEIRNLVIDGCTFAYNSAGGGADINLDAVVGGRVQKCVSVPTRGTGNVIALFHSDYNPSPTSGIVVDGNQFVAGVSRFNVIRAEDCRDVTVSNNTLVHTGFPISMKAGLIELDDSKFANTGKLVNWQFVNNKISGAVVINEAIKTLPDLGMTMAANVSADSAAVLALLPPVPDPGAIPAPPAPPEPPAPVPVVLPPLPADAPVCPAADPATVDLDQEGAAWYREWGTADRFGKDWKASSLGVPLLYGDMYSTPLLGKKCAAEPWGTAWTELLRWDGADGVGEFHVQARGNLGVVLGGQTIVEGSYYDTVTVTRAFRFKHGQYYLLDVGFTYMNDRVPELVMTYRDAEHPEAFRQIEPHLIFAPKDRGVPPFPPDPTPTPTPTPTPAPVPDSGVFEIKLTIPKELVRLLTGK